MKFLKGLAKAILVLLLMNLMMILTFSYSLPKVMTNGIMKELIIDTVVDQYLNQTFKNATGIDSDDINISVNGNNVVDMAEEYVGGEVKEAASEVVSNEDVKKILDSKDIQDFMNKYLTVVIEGAADSSNIDDVNLEEDIFKLITNHRADIEKLTGEKISDQDIEELKNELRESNINQTFKDGIQKYSNELPKEVRNALAWYTYFVSLSFRLIIIIAIVIDILLMALIDFNLGKTFKSIGWVMISCGVMILLLGYGSGFIILKITEHNIDTSSLILPGAILLGGGIVLSIIGSIMKKISSKKNNNNSGSNSTNNGGQGEIQEQVNNQVSQPTNQLVSPAASVMPNDGQPQIIQTQPVEMGTNQPIITNTTNQTSMAESQISNTINTNQVGQNNQYSGDNGVNNNGVS